MENNPVEVKKGGGNGHKTNWLTILKTYLKTLDDLTKAAGAGDLAAILADTAELQGDWVNDGRLDAILDLILADTAEVQVSLADGGWIDALIDTIKAETALIVADTNELQTDWHDAGRLDAILDAIKGSTDDWLEAGRLDAILDLILADTAELQTEWADGGRLDAILDLCALEATLTAIKGDGWVGETLVAIKAAIDAIAGVNTYQEIIPDIEINLLAIDDDLTLDPPNADAVNSVVDIDAIADPATTFVLRSLFVNVTSFGAGTKLTFSLWVPINGVITEVDSVDVDVLGFQNLADLFGLQEVHADSIHITVVTDDVAEPGVSACSGNYKYAKANS